MNKTEAELKERIKELTCLYKVSSIIVNADFENVENILFQICRNLKKAFSKDDKIEVKISVLDYFVSTSNSKVSDACIQGQIHIFNELKGEIIAYYPNPEDSYFLKEEQDLVNNVGIKIGSMLERVQLNESERSLKRQMERADRLVILGELTAGIAHELNTPLANILGFAELIKADLSVGKTAKGDLDKIIQNAIFSREVVKKLMFFACEMPHEMKELNLVPIIKDALNLLDSNFRKNQVKYIVEIEKKDIFLRADSIQMTQIIFNLCMNAIYFSPKNGLVSITAYDTKDSVILKISDEGKGLSDKELEKVFQPFFTTKAVGEGSGLGLSVVHGIVKSHKGKITAENNPIKGASFTVTLPK